MYTRKGVIIVDFNRASQYYVFYKWHTYNQLTVYHLFKDQDIFKITFYSN